MQLVPNDGADYALILVLRWDYRLVGEKWVCVLKFMHKNPLPLDGCDVLRKDNGAYQGIINCDGAPPLYICYSI